MKSLIMHDRLSFMYDNMKFQILNYV